MSRSRREVLQQTVAAGFAAYTMSPFVPAPGSPRAGHRGAGEPDLSPDTTGWRVRAQWRMEHLTGAWRRAAVSGRPLLVIVVPIEHWRHHRVGRAWGELLTAGSVKTIAALTRAELVTATQEEIHTVLPAYTVTSAGDEPLVVRIEAAEMPARYEAFATDIDIPTAAQEDAASEREYAEERALREGWITERIAAMEALVGSAAAAGPGAVLRAGPRRIAHRREADIPGSRWGYSGGCGTHYADDPLEDPDAPERRAMIACGLGHVDPRSRRFLDFLTHDPGNPVADWRATLSSED